jgi:hypothetical protein
MKALKILVAAAVFAASLTLIIAGQMHDGPLWLGAMLLGLIGLLVLLWWYNRGYTRADRLQKRQQKEKERAAHGK